MQAARGLVWRDLAMLADEAFPGGLAVLATSRSCSVRSLRPDGVALAGILRPGNAGSKTATDHIEAIDLAPPGPGAAALTACSSAW